MCKRIEIGEKLVPIKPYKYQDIKYNCDGFLSCENVLCEPYNVDCNNCPVELKIDIADIPMYDSEEGIVEVELEEGVWACSLLYFEQAKKHGITCEDMCCGSAEVSCSKCIFRNVNFDEDTFLSLSQLNWHILHE